MGCLYRVREGAMIVGRRGWCIHEGWERRDLRHHQMMMAIFDR